VDSAPPNPRFTAPLLIQPRFALDCRNHRRVTSSNCLRRAPRRGTVVSESVVLRSTEAASTAMGASPSKATRARVRSRFYVGMSGVVLLIVLVGFSPTLYLRSFFDVPDIPAYLVVHGVVHTAWFVFVLLQATLVAAHRTPLHRQVGRLGVGLGVATFAISLAVTVLFVQRSYVVDPNRLPTQILWANLAALLSFAVFLWLGVVSRRQLDFHRRFMLLAAISVVQPAIARIRQNFFESFDGALFSLVWLSALIIAMAVNDVRTTGRVHRVTAIGGLCFLGSRAFAQFVLAPSSLGMKIVRALVE